MAGNEDHLEAVESLAGALESTGFEPVLIGGMALVILGSRRVTEDFDFVVSTQGRDMKELMGVMYRHGLELVTRFNGVGDVVRTVDDPRVAAAKARAESPKSLFFAHDGTGLRIDLLLDFPFPAHALHERARKVTLKSRPVHVAAPEDLLKLKEVASSDRKLSADAQDLDFLRNLLGKDRPS
ncbi:MAG TPA: nucleotidyl transferase AbiEii/AbiGii toxin family protein [Planctomycetota bacterium]|nr:nucleotidyl transferase AbiEii/AbiGii toxin family protein [Planctomycetota bacterium]